MIVYDEPEVTFCGLEGVNLQVGDVLSHPALRRRRWWQFWRPKRAYYWVTYAPTGAPRV